jgi:hypothetical protein
MVPLTPSSSAWGGASPPLATVLRPLIARSYGATEAEAAVVEADAGPAPAAAGGAAEPGEVAPAAPAQDPVIERSRTSRIGYSPRRICPIPILAPLTHITMHIVKAPRVCFLSFYFVRFIIVIPPHVI